MSQNVKRTWYYVQNPKEHGIECPTCFGTILAWSEYDKHVWCYRCEKDFSNYVSVLDGPFPVAVGSLLGISVDRFLMEEKMIEHYDVEKKEYIKMTIEEYKKLC